MWTFVIENKIIIKIIVFAVDSERSFPPLHVFYVENTKTYVESLHHFTIFFLRVYLETEK